MIRWQGPGTLVHSAPRVTTRRSTISASHRHDSPCRASAWPAHDDCGDVSPHRFQTQRLANRHTEGYLMDTDLIHYVMAITFLALWAMIGHIAVVRRRS